MTHLTLGLSPETPKNRATKFRVTHLGFASYLFRVFKILRVTGACSVNAMKSQRAKILSRYAGNYTLSGWGVQGNRFEISSPAKRRRGTGDEYGFTELFGRYSLKTHPPTPFLAERGK